MSNVTLLNIDLPQNSSGTVFFRGLSMAKTETGFALAVNYFSDDGPGYAFGRFDETGAIETAMTEIGFSVDPNYNQPVLGVMADGALQIHWTSTNDARLADPGGFYSGVARTVLDGTGQPVVDEVLDYGFGASSTYFGDGSHLVTWWVSEDWNVYGDGDATGVFARYFDSDGDELGPRIQVNTETTGIQIQPRSAELSNGNSIIVWAYSDGTTLEVRGQIMTAQGIKIGSELRLHTSAGDEVQPWTVGGLTGGGFVVSWGDSVRQFDSSGALVAEPLSTLPALFSDRSKVAVEALSDGGYVVVWHGPSPSEAVQPDEAHHDLFGQRFDAGGVALGNVFRVNIETDGRQSNPVLQALEGGDYVVVWDNSEGRLIQNDEALGGPLDDDLLGTVDADEIYAWEGNDSVLADAGNDAIWGGSGDDTLWGQEGQDTIRGESGADLVYAGADADAVAGHDGNDTLNGGSGDDRIFGGADQDILRGDDGHDSLEGNSGHDAMAGHDGNDTLNGGSGNDRLFGGADNDVLRGNEGDDSVEGNSGSDAMAGNDGNDTLNGGDGNDRLYGGADNDILRGNEGDDSLEGNSGSDAMAGHDGLDTLNGGAGSDRLFGGAGNDVLDGGLGNDLVNGGTGTDLLTGGAGADVFEFRALSDSLHGAARDTITDFEDGVDRIDLSDIMPGLSFVASYTGTAGEVRYSDVIGRLYIDTDGDQASEFSVDVTGALTIDASDLIL